MPRAAEPRPAPVGRERLAGKPGREHGVGRDAVRVLGDHGEDVALVDAGYAAAATTAAFGFGFALLALDAMVALVRLGRGGVFSRWRRRT